MGPLDHIPPEAAAQRIADLDGRDFELRETWASRPAVLAFVRHFG